MLNAWFIAIRPKTLSASIAPVLLGNMLAAPVSQLNQNILYASLLCALFLQIAVNLANDLFDYLSGVDNEQRLGPVRAIQAGLISQKALKIALAITVTIAVTLGLYLVNVGGFTYFLLGLFSVLGVFAYSAGASSLASKGLGEVTVFVFFGLIAVLGSYHLQTSIISTKAIVLAINAGLLSSAIMLVNNIRDISTDKAANKITLAVRLGEQWAKYLYIALIILPLVIHSLVIANSTFLITPVAVCVVPAIYLLVQSLTLSGSALNKLLAQTAFFNLIYCLATAITWQIYIAA